MGSARGFRRARAFYAGARSVERTRFARPLDPSNARVQVGARSVEPRILETRAAASAPSARSVARLPPRCSASPTPSSSSSSWCSRRSASRPARGPRSNPLRAGFRSRRARASQCPKALPLGPQREHAPRRPATRRTRTREARGARRTLRRWPTLRAWRLRLTLRRRQAPRARSRSEQKRGDARSSGRPPRARPSPQAVSPAPAGSPPSALA